MTTRHVRWSIATACAALAALLAGACGQAAEGETASADATVATPQQTARDTIDLRDIGYDRGAPDAPIAVIEFSDFGCPFCGRFALETYPELHREYIETGKVVWKYVPFVMGMFPNGAEAARAAECAAEQGPDHFWAMHDLLYERQREWKTAADPEPLFRELAGSLALDDGRFASCYRENRPAERTRAANQVAAYAGVRATPTFFINGYRVQGALPLEQFRMILDEMLAR